VWRRIEDSLWSRQCYARGLAWGGLKPAMPRLKLFGGSLGLPASSLRSLGERLMRPRTVFLPAFELNRTNVCEYVATARASGAKHLIGYSSALHLMALLAEDAGERCQFESVYPTAELLLPEWGEQIRRVFRCKVLPYYGCGEVNSLAFSCGHDQGYHVCDEHAVIEIETSHNTFAFEGEGAFLVTDLDNYAMPFLRYRNGDAGILTGERCGCGRELSRILQLHGRVNDYLLSARGDPVPGAIAPHLFRLVGGVRFYQFVQNAPGQVIVRIVATDDYQRDAEEAKIRQVLKTHLGADASIVFEYRDDVERTPAGKARFVISNCSRDAGREDAGDAYPRRG